MVGRQKTMTASETWHMRTMNNFFWSGHTVRHKALSSQELGPWATREKILRVRSARGAVWCLHSMDGTAFCLVTATNGDEVLDPAFRSLFYLLTIWEFLLTAADMKKQVHSIVLPTLALTVNLSQSVPTDKTIACVSETTMPLADWISKKDFARLSNSLFLFKLQRRWSHHV